MTHPRAPPPDASLPKSLHPLGLRLRKLLLAGKVETAEDLTRIDMLSLLSVPGIGRQDLRTIRAFLQERGLKPLERAAAPRGSPRTIVLRFNKAFSNAIQARAEQERISPEEWVMRAVSARLNAPPKA